MKNNVPKELYPILGKVKKMDLKGYTESHPYENGIESKLLQTEKGQPYGFPKPISKIIRIPNINFEE